MLKTGWRRKKAFNEIEFADDRKMKMIAEFEEKNPRILLSTMACPGGSEFGDQTT